VKTFYLKAMAKSGWKIEQDLAKSGIGEVPRASEIGEMYLGTRLVDRPITHHLIFTNTKRAIKQAIISISKGQGKSKITILLYSSTAIHSH